MRGHQLDHFAGTDEQNVQLGQVFEQLPGQSHRRGGHADGVRADLGGGAHFLGHRKRALEHLVQGGTQRAGRVGFTHGLLHLPQNLRLAQHHRVQAAGDAEGMPCRCAALQHVGVVAQRAATHAAHAGQPLHGRQHQIGVGTHVQFGAVASGDDGGFWRALHALPKCMQRGCQLLGRKREPRAQVQRCGGVVQAKGEHAHS